ncbi:MAG: T9SS type A sorting domain-containing protein [Candidatus Kapabacteria bacterium]|nr:T9SS type A sorting domain-containing protein [Candidatus Kapabacteria bacterium]
MTFFRLAVCTVILTISAHAQYWVQTTGPSAPTVCLATNSKGHVFAGTAFSKVYRTTDGGLNWEPFDNGIFDGINFTTISQIRVAPNDVLYAAVYGKGIMRSDDNGETWKLLNLNINNVSATGRFFVDLKRQSSGKLTVFAAYDGGPTAMFMRISEDGGETFTDVSRSNIPTQASSIFGVFMTPNSDKLFVLVNYNKGLYRTTDRGGSWRRIDTDASSGESDDTFKSAAFDEKGHLYVGRNALPGSTRTPNAVVMKSTNDGESWTYLTSGWDNRDITNNRISSIVVGKSGRIWATLEKASGPFLSTDYGATWTAIKDGFEGDDGAASSVIIASDGAEYIAPISGFVMRHPGVTSVNEIPSSLQALAYPNPASDRLRVELGANVVGQVEVDLIDASGRSVLPTHSTMTDPATVTTLWLSTDNLPSGMYSAVVRSQGGVRTIPVAVVR